MITLKNKDQFQLGNKEFTFVDLIADGYNVEDQIRLHSIKKSGCIKSSYTEKDFIKPEITLKDKQRFFFLGNTWIVVVVDEDLKTSDCVRFIKL